MPTYVAFGLTKAEVMEACPIELEYVFKAQKIRKKMSDINNWELGMYIESAVATAVDHNLNGYKARSGYVKEPFTKTIEVNERQKLLDNNKLLMASLEVWATNWKLAHQSEDNDNG